MMARSHITLSALSWLIVAPPVAEQFGRPLDSATLAASTLACAGAALWPDWDHPQATLAHTLGPVTRKFAALVAGVSGGHRRGTHTLAFCILTGLATTLLSNLPSRVGSMNLPTNWGSLILLFGLAYTAMLALGLAVSKQTGLGEGIYAAQALIAVLATAVFVPGHWWWMPWAVGVGCLLHCIEDILTAGGLPWFWRPFSHTGARLGFCGETGGYGEILTATAGFAAFQWVALATFTGNDWWSASWLM